MYNRFRGFTLIELLVVIGLIGVLVGGIGFAMLGGGGGGLQNTERVLQGFLLSARTNASSAIGGATGQTAALADGASSLLLINADSTDQDGYLREMYVVYWGTDVDGVTGWLTQSGSSTLPNGIYFYPQECQDPSATGSSFVGGSMTMNMDPPSAIAQAGTGGSKNWYFIPYDERGRLNDIDEFQVVIAEGDLLPGNTPPIEFADDPNRGGYLILNTGAIARFPSQEAIQ
ncbi:MAG: pilus assembly FimT family protein [Opitutales bacterium]